MTYPHYPHLPSKTLIEGNPKTALPSPSFTPPIYIGGEGKSEGYRWDREHDEGMRVINEGNIRTNQCLRIHLRLLSNPTYNII